MLQYVKTHVRNTLRFVERQRHLSENNKKTHSSFHPLILYILWILQRNLLNGGQINTFAMINAIPKLDQNEYV